MSKLSDQITREHPNYATGSMIDGAECSTCGAPVEAIGGRVDLGWNRHIAVVTEAAVREQLARDLHSVAERWATVADDFQGAAALRAVLALHQALPYDHGMGVTGATCLECVGWEHPCPTVRAITKALA